MPFCAAISLLIGLCLAAGPAAAQEQETIYAVNVTPDNLPVTANPGSASYTFVVKNLGNTQDTFDLSVTCSGSASACSPAVTSVAASAGSSKNIVVSYQAAVAGGAGTVTLAATSRGDPAIADGGSIQVTVPPPYAVAVTPDGVTDTAWLYTPASRAFTVRNSGSQRATYLLRFLCSGRAASDCSLAPESVTLDPAQATTAIVSYAPQAHGDTGSISVTARYSRDTTILDNGSVRVEARSPCVGTWGELVRYFSTDTNPAFRTPGLQKNFSVSNRNPLESASYALTCVPSGAVTSCYFPSGNPIDTARHGITIPSGTVGSFTLRYATVGTDTTGSIKVVAHDYDSLTATVNVVLTRAPDPTGVGGQHLVGFDLTPDYQTVRADRNTTVSHTATLTNRGTRSDTFTVVRSCSGPAIASGCSPASEQHIVPAGASIGLPLTLTTAGDPSAIGTATLVVARQSHAGDPDTSRVDVVLPNTPSRAVEVTSVNPGPTVDRTLCLRIAAGSGAEYDCGDLRVLHALPATMTLSKARVPTLLYNNRFADPRGLVAALVHVPASATLPGNVTAQLTVGASVVANGSWAGSDWRLGETRRIALDFDASSYATGSYRYVLSVSRDGAAADTASGDIIIVNRRSSPFGAGWWLAGLEQLVTRGDTLLWVGGDGSAQRYLRDAGAPAVFRPVLLDQRDSITFDATRQSYARHLPNRLRVEYDSAGRHQRTINRRGDTTIFRYEGATARCLTSITLPPVAAGRSYGFTYDDNCASVSSRLTGVTAPSGGAPRVTGVFINGSQQVDSIVGPDGHPIKYGYAAGYAARISSRTDRRGTTTSYAYGAAGVLTEVQTVIDTGAAGTIRVSFVPQETRGIAGQPAATLESAHTALDGPRSDVPDTTRFWLDGLGAPARVRNALGDETIVYREDARFPALVTKVRAPEGAVSTAVHDSLGRVTQVADSSTCDAGSGQCATTTYTWKGDWHLVATVTPPLGTGTTYDYDDLGNLRWQQPGSDATRRVELGYHPAFHLPTSTLQPGATLRDSIDYDALGNVRFVQSELGEAYRTVFHKDAIGLDTLVVSPIDVGSGGTPGSLFLTTRTSYDMAGRDTLHVATRPAIATGKGPSGAATHYQRKSYDREGNLVRHAQWISPDPGGLDTLITRWEYDRANRKTREIAPRALRFPGDKYDSTAYDPAGNVVLYRTRVGNRVTMQYDALGRMVSRVVPERTIAILTGYTWGTRIPADTIRHVFDGGRLVAASNFTSRIRRRYYPNGTLAADTVRIRIADPAAVDFTWHVYGLEHGYDLEGRRLWTRYPASLRPAVGQDSVAYGYDPVSGGVAWVEDMFRNRQTFTYTPAGQLESRTIPGGVTTRHVYHADGSLRRRTDENGPTLLHDDSLFYDARGKLTQAAVLVSGGYADFLMAYDGFGALTYGESYHEMKRRETLTVDALQNVISARNEGNASTTISPRSYEAGNGQLTVLLTDESTVRRDSTSYEYDASGNRTRATSLRRVRDDPISGPMWLKTLTRQFHAADDRLVAVSMQRDSVQGGMIVAGPYHEHEEYWYDALGRRITTRVRRNATCKAWHLASGCRTELRRLLWDGDQLVAEVKTPDASRETDVGIGTPHFGRVLYVHGGTIDRPLAIVRLEYGGTTVAIPHVNYRGVFDSGTCVGSGGIPCDQIEWPAALASAYLELSRSDSGETNWFGSLVAEHADAAGLMYRRNRYYDPATGTFTQEDPIGLAGGLNLYGYAGGDPVNFADPFGLCPNCRNELSSRTIDEEIKFQKALTPRDRVALGAMGLGAAAAGVGVMAASAGAVAKASVVTFFRGVGAAEAAQIGADKVLKAVGGIEGAKYLTNTAQAAAEWGRRMHGESARVVEVTVNRAAAKGFEYLGRIDGIGQAWVAKVNDLKDATVRILPK